jgi:hypothetical protein
VVLAALDHIHALYRRSVAASRRNGEENETEKANFAHGGFSGNVGSS